MFVKKTKYKNIKEGNYVYLDDDGTETKKYFFGLFSKEVSKRSLYKVVEIMHDSESFIRLATISVERNCIRNIIVTSYQRVSFIEKL